MPTSPTPITELPAAPNPDDDESVFDNSAYTWSASLPNFRAQANAIASVTYGNAQEAVNAAGAAAASASSAATQATTATTQAGIATTKAGEAAASASSAGTAAGSASASATAAADSAAAAAAIAGTLTGTSTSSLAIGSGSKTFITQAGELYVPGIFMIAVDQANSANYMAGQVVSYSGTSLVINVSITAGSGTVAAWNLSLSGAQGAQGIQGIQGPAGGISGGAMTAHLSELKAANIIAATTTNVWAAAGNSATLVGTTAVTSFGTAAQAGDKFTLLAGAATPLTNGANLVLPGGADYTTTAGDRLEIFAETATKMVVSILKSDGTPVIGGVTYSARTSNVVLTRADTGKFIDISSGTFTQTFDTLSNFPAGWAVWIRNSGSGDITIPASDGRTNWIMYTGETRLFMKDAAAGSLKTQVIEGFSRVFTTSETFIKPPGYRDFVGEMWPGGHGGRGGSGAGGPAAANGGAGASATAFSIPASLVGNSEWILVGDGGAAGMGGVSGVYGADGGVGGDSAIGTLLSTSGPGQGPYYSGGDGGNAGAGGSATMGGGGGGIGEYPPSLPGVGGRSKLVGSGGNGGPKGVYGVDGGNGQNGEAGAAPGGGGGGGGVGAGGSTGKGGAGGPGGRGEVRIRGAA